MSNLMQICSLNIRFINNGFSGKYRVKYSLIIKNIIKALII